MSHLKTLADFVGQTPLVKLNRIGVKTNATLLAKLEGNNPAGSVKDRPAFHMVVEAEKRGELKRGDQLIEATSGNTGIALAMVAAMRGYRMTLIMPANATQERKDAMSAYGATLIETPDMESARDLALQMQTEGKGIVLDQFNNNDNKHAHFVTTGPEIWQQTNGSVTHFISAMGTTGTISGIGRYLKSQNPKVKVIGLQPADTSNIPGIRRWERQYLPSIYDEHVVDEVRDVAQVDAENAMRQLAREEGIFCGVSSGGAAWAAQQIAQEVSAAHQEAVIVFIVCDRGDRYLSTGLFSS